MRSLVFKSLRNKNGVWGEKTGKKKKKWGRKVGGGIYRGEK